MKNGSYFNKYFKLLISANNFIENKCKYHARIERTMHARNTVTNALNSRGCSANLNQYHRFNNGLLNIIFRMHFDVLN